MNLRRLLSFSAPQADLVLPHLWAHATRPFQHRAGQLIPIGLCLAYQVTTLDAATTSELVPGLQVSFTAKDTKLNEPQDVLILPTVALYVPDGQSATPFLATGPFTAVWEGFISADLRAEYRFQAELAGDIEIRINGTNVLRATANGTRPQTSEPVRLNKGTNSLRVLLDSAPTGDTLLRLSWIPKGGLPAPLPSQAVAHLPNAPDFLRAQKRRFGRELFLQLRCAKCHPGRGAVAAEEDLDAPSLDGIGSRRQLAWLGEWIADPKHQRPLARMPRLLPTQATNEVRAIAAFLFSLKAPHPNAASSPNGSAQSSATDQAPTETGKKLFENLHCAACHEAPGQAAPAPDPATISLASVKRKFTEPALRTFLQKPEADYAWTRMPNFKLSESETSALAAYLLIFAAPAEPAPAPLESTSDLLARGRMLVQKSGCLSCHTLRLDNQFKGPSLSSGPTANWESGCVAETPNSSSKAPFFGFSKNERDALRLFGQTDLASLERSAPIEFALRETQDLRCGECHGKFDGFPRLQNLQGKLKPEWSRSFIAGDIPYRPRPWLESRMPCFTRYAAGLANGTALMNGYPAVTAAEPPIDDAQAKVGHKLVGIEGGLSCITCHAVGRFPATQVFENGGINLAYATSRLLRPYFERWIRNPLAVDPVSKMPMFFDEELRSPLVEFYDGDGGRQIQAIWQFLRLGDKMPPPAGVQLSN